MTSHPSPPKFSYGVPRALRPGWNPYDRMNRLHAKMTLYLALRHSHSMSSQVDLDNSRAALNYL